ncbi:MAG: hypothetical protein MUQ52_11980 [Pirellulales bacterium]|nr:hypothetical protein [Pirellulales bacterium]
MIRRNKEKPVFIMLVVLIACCLSACEHVFAGETVAAETVTEIQFDPSWDFSEITVPVGDGYQQSACCPDWCQYGIVDFLFLQRDNATSGAVITEEGSQRVPVFTTRSMQPATAPGVRLFYGELGPDCMGWEVGYLGVYGMFGAVDRSSFTDSLVIPGDLGGNTPGWTTADEVRPTYASSLNTVEANIFTYRCCPECSSDTLLWSHLGNKPVCHCSNWLFGFRWAGLEEQADLNVLCCRVSNDVFTSYSVRTSSQMLGPQVGFRGRRQWNNWAVEGWAKAMLAGTLLSSNADPIFSSLAPTAIIRPARRLTDAGVGFLGDLNYTVSRRLSDMWWLRLGYNMIWLSGVALAPDQWDFTNQLPTLGGTTLVGGGGVFLHGANLGLEARW